MHTTLQIQIKRIAILFTILFFLLTMHARSATYNFYFNNTEQGDHSTATPNLVVKDGKEVKKDDGTEEDSSDDSSDDQSSDDNTPPSKDSPQNKNTQHPPPGDEKYSHFRVSFGGGFGRAQYDRMSFKSVFDSDYNFFNSRYTQTNSNTFNDFILTSTYMFTPQFGGSLFLSGSNIFSGLEAELYPFTSGKNPIEFGLLVGFTFADFFGDFTSHTAIHGGARLTANFSKTVALTSTIRRSLTSGDDNFSFTMGEVAFAFRF